MKKKKILIILSIVIFVFLGTYFIVFNNKSYSIFSDGVYLGSLSRYIPAKSDNYVVTVSCNNANGFWDYDNWKPMINNIVGEVSCQLEFDTSSNFITLANHLINQSNESETIFHEFVNGTDIGYRYQPTYLKAMNSIDNYVYFNNDIWRIVGVFNDSSHGLSGQNLVKIIKDDIIISQYEYHINSKSAFNGTDTYDILQDFYNNKITDYYKSLIQPAFWVTRLCNFSENSTLSEIYFNCDKFVNESSSYYQDYISLLNLSDIYFAYHSSQLSRNTSFNNLSSTLNNWIVLYNPYNNLSFLTPYGDVIKDFLLYSLTSDNLFRETQVSVKPAVYLKAEVFARSGTGTYDDPYILELNK